MRRDRLHIKYKTSWLQNDGIRYRLVSNDVQKLVNCKKENFVENSITNSN